VCRDTPNCAATLVYENRVFNSCDSKNSIAALIRSILGEMSRVEDTGKILLLWWGEHHVSPSIRRPTSVQGTVTGLKSVRQGY
jgi:hypothetical protein